MGRPIKKSLMGTTVPTGEQLICAAWVPGDSQSRTGTLVNQKGSYTYTALTSFGSGRCKLTDTTAAAAGQMTVKVYPFGISTGTGATATVSLRVATAAVAAGGTGYAVGNVLTVSTGAGTSATVTVATVSTGVVTGVTLTNAGNYTTVPTLTGVATTGGAGTGCTLNLTLEISQYTITAPGTDYQTATVALSSGTGTGTVVISNGLVTAITPLVRGTYTTIPTATIAASGSGSVEYAKKITAKKVTTFSGNTYAWKTQNQDITAGYANLESA